MNTKITPQYIAGFFDADGHIGIYNRGNKTRVRKDGSIAIYPTGYGINFAIVNVDYSVMEQIQKVLGGTVTLRKAKNSKHNDTYVLNLTSRQTVLDAINIMLPYLIVKEKRCSLIKEYLEERISTGIRGNNKPVTQHQLDIINEVRNLIHDNYKKKSTFNP